MIIFGLSNNESICCHVDGKKLHDFEIKCDENEMVTTYILPGHLIIQQML